MRRWPACVITCSALLHCVWDSLWVCGIFRACPTACRLVHLTVGGVHRKHCYPRSLYRQYKLAEWLCKLLAAEQPAAAIALPIYCCRNSK
jgi:hypothetical protein